MNYALIPDLLYTPSQFNALQTTADTTSDPIAIPDNGGVLTWQSSFAVAPGAVSLALQASIDGVTYFQVDTSTNVNGEMRQLTPFNWKFIKVRQVSRTGNTAYLTISLLLKHK